MFQERQVSVLFLPAKHCLQMFSSSAMPLVGWCLIAEGIYMAGLSLVCRRYWGVDVLRADFEIVFQNQFLNVFQTYQLWVWPGWSGRYTALQAAWLTSSGIYSERKMFCNTCEWGTQKLIDFVPLHLPMRQRAVSPRANYWWINHTRYLVPGSCLNTFYKKLPCS